MAIRTGDDVAIRYEVRLEDGVVLDTNMDAEPLVFEVGAGQLIGGVDAAVVGREAGDRFTVLVEPSEGYGERDDGRTHDVPRSAFSGRIPAEGDVIELRSPDGEVQLATVTGIGEDEITLDLNHPLAGKWLHFTVEIVEVL